MCKRIAAFACLFVLFSAGRSGAQITSYGGDGVLNAPYRGTINSLREATMDVGYGEVQNHTEPLSDTTTNGIQSATIDAWVDVPGGSLPWDRSILRLYNGADASGTEIDLTNTSTSSPVTLSTDTSNSPAFNRFSFRAMGTKSLAIQTFRISFRYRLGTSPPGTLFTYTRIIKVAPVTGSFLALPGESEAFHYGTPILSVSVGNARLVVPVGRKAEMIGAAFIDKDVKLGSSGIETSDYLFPGAAESVYIQNFGSFRLLGNSIGLNKTAYGTPWPGYLVGFYNNGHIYGGDGTRYLNISTAISSTTPGKEIRRTQYITPFWRNQTDPPSQAYIYDGSNRIVTIQDGAGNSITLTRNGSGVVTRVSTSDGRGWNIESNDPNGWITGVVPDSGQGAQYYSHNTDGRVTEVRLSQTAGTNVMYQFVYDSTTNGDLREEWRYIEADGQLRKVVEHVVVSESLRQRKEYFGTGVNDFRQYDFAYDTTASPAPLNHRLKSITSYSGPAGTGTPYTTTYTNDVGSPTDPPNSAGTMVLTDVALPDGTTIHHDYDSQYNPQIGGTRSINVGFRTKTTRTGPNDGSLVTLDRDYEFFYSVSGSDRLFYRPRVVRQRDGRYPTLNTEVVYDYENGNTDENGDGINGEEMNQLLKRTGPTITLGTSGTRTPETRYTYNNTASGPTKIGTLRHQETDFASGQFRVIEFTYDSLLRLATQTVDPADKSLVTTYQYVDNLPTQDRIVIDPDNYYSKTTYDNDGRLLTEQRFLNAGVTSGASYGTTNAYDTNGRLQTRTVENKDQDGNSLAPATNVTQFAYDRIGRLMQKVVDPTGIGQQSNFIYTWQNEIESEYDTSLRGVKRTYDGRGLQKTEVPLDNTGTEVAALTTTYDYNAASGYLEYITRPTGAKVKKIYDDFGRLAQEQRIPITGSGSHTITSTFEYDAANHVTRTYVDENGTALVDSTAQFDEGGFNYESRQRTTAGADNASDPVTQRKFDWAGNVTEEKSLGDTTVGDRIVTTDYDGASRVETVSDAEGGLTTYTRDHRGNVTQQTVKLTASTTADTVNVYDALSRAIQITDPEGNDTIRLHDSRGNLLRETRRDAADVPKLTTVFAYDNAGRQTQQAVLLNPAGFATPPSVTTDRVVDLTYDADGRLAGRTSYNNNQATPLTTVTIYDAVGRVDRVTDPSGSYTDEDYDPNNGRLSQRRINDGLGERTFTFGYDGHDRVNLQTAVGTPNLVTDFGYDGLDRQISVTDPKTITAVTQYDLVGRRTGLIEDNGGPKQRQTTFAYNRLSQLITQTAENKTSGGGGLANQVTTFRHDTMDRQTRIVYPDSGQAPETCTDCVQMAYDLAGRMTSRTDQRGLLTSYVYDGRGLLLTRTTGSAVDSFTYDAVARLSTSQRGTTSSAFFYTGLGDLDYETQTIAGGSPRTVGYGYDQAGNRTGLLYPSGETLAYAPTAINQVASATLNSNAFLNYSYYGRMLDKRRTTTNAPGGTTRYDYQLGYDSHDRINATNNALDVNGTPQAIASYGFTLDDNGNPLTQTATGMPDFSGDNRTFTVDSLNRLIATTYSNGSDSMVLDLVGNRESYTDRAGHPAVAYSLANPSNEYATIGGETVTYDVAGNLTVDEQGRHYDYDEQNRLTQIRADDNTTVLADYAYDALGRRVISDLNGVTTRYYYDGQNVIEERNGSDARVRYHVNGSQYIDERVATHDDASGQFTYYLLKENFSVAGAGNADGSTITRTDYSSTGDFAGAAGSGIDVDYNNDGDVDSDDFNAFDACFTGPNVPQDNPSCADKKLDGDSDVDQADFAIFQRCYSGTDNPAAPECTGGAGPTNGTFTLHGRPVDVLADGHALLYVRARYYDLTNGRWLQRDPIPYNDGTNQYESFRGNALRNQDPSGEGILTWLLAGRYDASDWEFIKGGGLQAAQRGYEEGVIRTVTGMAVETGRQLGYGLGITSTPSSLQRRLEYFIDAEAKYSGAPTTAYLTERALLLAAADMTGVSSGEAAVKGDTVVFLSEGDVTTVKLTLYERLESGVASVGQMAGTVSALGMSRGKVGAQPSSFLSRLRHSGTIGESPLQPAYEIQLELKSVPLSEPIAPSRLPEVLAYRGGIFEVLTEQPVTGSTRAAHVTAANRALLRQLKADAQLANQLNDVLGVEDVVAWMRSGKRVLRNPPRTEWHHPIDKPDVMWLLRSETHHSPDLQSILHPDNVGGFGTYFGN